MMHLIPPRECPALPTHEHGLSGFTKREQAALAFALQMQRDGWTSTEQVEAGEDGKILPQYVAKSAVKFADALFDELERGKMKPEHQQNIVYTGTSE